MSRTWMAMAVLAAVVPVAAQQNDPEQIRARQRISMMEGVLERAVANGADNLLRQARAVMSETPRLTGAPEARGFRLDDYGLFFDVEVPGLSLPMTWPLRHFVLDNRDLARVTAELRALSTQVNAVDAQMGARLAEMVRSLELQTPGPRVVVRSPGNGPGALPSTVVQVDPMVMDDPQEGYTREVQAALVLAMVENSSPLGLDDDEWLTVAARDSMPRDPLIPGDASSFSTLILRVRGSDLAAFRAGRLTLEEARGRVDVREY